MGRRVAWVAKQGACQNKLQDVASYMPDCVDAGMPFGVNILHKLARFKAQNGINTLHYVAYCDILCGVGARGGFDDGQWPGRRQGAPLF